jgi:hypothetical protein
MASESLLDRRFLFFRGSNIRVKIFGLFYDQHNAEENSYDQVRELYPEGAVHVSSLNR